MMNTAAASFQAGSFEHRKLLARFFLDTHLNYSPEAIELQGFEEKRHARLLMELTANYAIPVQQPPRFTPQKLESDFLSAGYGECLDSFFAVGRANGRAHHAASTAEYLPQRERAAHEYI
jgi:hypothetical protein